jgi:hypothetical protein
MMRFENCRNPKEGFECGLVSGLSQTFIFNAYDKALFHSIANRRPFMDPANWKGNPFTGVSPSFLQRAFSSGLYFPLEDVFRAAVSDNTAVAGVLVGLVGGLFTTPFNSVKYTMWSATPGEHSKSGPSMMNVTSALLKEGGIRRLMRGATPTLYRDMTFGLSFSFLRHQGDNGFGINVMAAFIATTISSPFNYARMKIYSQERGPKQVWPILTELFREAKQQPGDRISFVFNRLNVGWGALRVSLGMGVGSQIYNHCCG